jgi:pentatricopeptide repeat protein
MVRRQPGTADTRLDSWKAIAAHLGRTVRTVQRWERDEDLPVRRLKHHSLSSVYAFAGDLDAWLQKREPSVAQATRRQGHAVLGATTGGAFRRIDPAAYESYLRARHFMGRRTVDAIGRAIQEYRNALDVDPAWAQPYAGIAEAYVVLAGSEFKAPRDGYPRARAAALQALELDPGLASAHASLGFVEAFFDADWAGAASAFDAALESDPNSAVAHYWSGLVLMNQGRFAEATGAIRRAVDLEPLSAAMTANVARPLIVSGDWDGALDWCQRAMDLDPEFWLVHLFNGFAHDGKGDHEEARRSFEKALALGGSGGVWGALAHACAKQGDHNGARQMLHEMTTQKATYVPPVRFARVHTALGNRDEAFTWLDRACEDLSIRSNVYPTYDYALAPLRSDPRFEQVVRALRLQPAGRD